MRKSVLISLLVFCTLITQESAAQISNPYLDSTSTWYEAFGATNGITIYKDLNKYFLEGDTFITGYTYYRLYWDVIDSTFDAFANTFLSVNYFNHVYQGGLREDSLHRFYILFPGHTAESLLFDFNLSGGDSLPDMISNYGCNVPAVTVSSIDSVYLGSRSLKLFHLPPSSFNKTIYEGIGSSGGFIWSGSLCTGIESGACLIAYKKGPDSIYFNCGSAVTSIAENENKNYISVNPNPASDFLRINYAFASRHFFRLFNKSGKEIKTVRLDEKSNSFVIQIEGLANGIYFWEVLDEGKSTQYGKILIVK